MNAPAQLHALGQSPWLDNIARSLLDNGTLARYIAELSVTSLTSNPTIYDRGAKCTGSRVSEATAGSGSSSIAWWLRALS
jgi:transaldolase